MQTRHISDYKGVFCDLERSGPIKGGGVADPDGCVLTEVSLFFTVSVHAFRSGSRDLDEPSGTEAPQSHLLDQTLVFAITIVEIV